jgi:hypothetical protein
VLSITTSHCSGLGGNILDAEFCSPEQDFYPVGNGLLDLDHGSHLLRRSFRRPTFGEVFGGKNVLANCQTQSFQEEEQRNLHTVCSHRSLTTRSYRLGVIPCFKSSWLRSDLAVPSFPFSFLFLQMTTSCQLSVIPCFKSSWLRSDISRKLLLASL